MGPFYFKSSCNINISNSSLFTKLETKLGFEVVFYRHENRVDKIVHVFLTCLTSVYVVLCEPQVIISTCTVIVILFVRLFVCHYRQPMFNVKEWWITYLFWQRVQISFIKIIIQYSYIYRDLSNNKLVEIPETFFPFYNRLDCL